MAKKSSAADFRQILAAVKAGKFKPVYLLMGEEDYYIDYLVNLLAEKVVSEGERDFNAITYYGSDSDIGTVIGSAQQYPVFADRKIVFLKEAQTMMNAKSQLEKLASYVQRPNAGTVLVVTYKGDNIPATHPLMKSTNGNDDVVVFKSEKIADYQLGVPVREYCSEKGVNIDDKAVSLLCDYIGNPLSKLFGEIDKLILSMDAGSHEITAETIEKNIGISKDFNSFELLKALTKKEYPKAMMILEYFARNPKNNPAIVTIAVIFNFFSKLCIACALQDKSDNALMAELELKNTFALRDYKDALRNYSFRAVCAILHEIRNTDAQSKGIGSTTDEYDLLKELIFKIFTLK